MIYNIYYTDDHTGFFKLKKKRDINNIFQNHIEYPSDFSKWLLSTATLGHVDFFYDMKIVT